MLPFSTAAQWRCGLTGEEHQTMTRALLKATVMAGLVMGLASAAWADTAADAIAQRQAGYKAIGAATGDIKKAMEAGGDLTAVAAKAEVVSAFAKRIPALFPAGSGTESGVKTRALPAIWQNRAAFDAAAAGLGTAAGAQLAAAQANNEAAFRAGMAAIGQACGACHTPFRAPQ